MSIKPIQWIRIWILAALALWGLVAEPVAAEGVGLLEAGGSVVLEEVSFQVQNPYPDDFDWAGLAKALVNLQPGDLLTLERLEQAQSALATFGRIETSLDQGRLVFGVVPLRRIKSIKFKGNHPLFEQEVRDVMTISLGMDLNPEQIHEQISLIAQRYRSEGYIDPQVAIHWRQDPQDGHYHVSVIIDKGDFYRVGAFNMSGNQAFPESLLKAKMASWRTYALWAGQGRFAVYKFKNDIDSLLAFYRKQGYADAVVTYTLSPDAEQRQIHVNISIQEGPLYEISFLGNRQFLDYTLEKDLELLKVGNRGNIGLRRSIQNIRRRYVRAGFADVRVRWIEVLVIPADQDRRPLQIEIDEGRRHIVRSVKIKGEGYFSDKKLQKQMLTRPPNGLGNGVFDAQVLNEDLDSIRALYQKYGFVDARISERVDIRPSDKSVSVTVLIEEGLRTRVGRITFEGHTPIAARKLIKALQLKQGQPFQPDLVRVDESNLAARIAPLGYPHVKVVSRVTRSKEPNLAHIAYEIQSGPYVQVGSIFFAGNFRTRDPILERELEFESGDPFSLSKILAAQRNLRGLNLFETVQVRTIGLKEQASTVHLLIVAVEKKPYFYELGGGYETSKGFYMRSKVGDHNFRGTDKDVWVGGEVAETGYRWDAGISNPRLFGVRMQADLGGFIEREEQFNQDFGTDTAGSTLNISQRWPRFLTTSLAWRYERRRQFLREQDASEDIDQQALEPRSNLVTTPAIIYDNRDSFIRPRRGWFSNLSVDFSNGLDNDLDDFVRYKADLRVYHSVRRKLTLAGMVRLGYMVAFGENSNIPEDQLFFLGGTLDVRGYKENLLAFDAERDPAGGRLALSTSIEARYDIGRNFELTSFVDAGRLQLLPENTEDDGWRFSVGLGLRYLTPIGPIGLLYGHKIDRRSGERPGQFHFTIGYTF